MEYFYKEIFKKAAAIILTTIIITQFLVIKAEDNSSSSQGYLQSIMEMIQDKYKSDVSDKQLIDGAIKGMFSTMDPYTVFYTKDEAQSFFSTLEGAFDGIGIEVTKSSGLIFISDVIDTSPAAKAGIRTGDVIEAINGTSTSGMTMEKAASLIGGEKGTSVKLGILRENNKKTLQFSIKRDEVIINPVTCQIKDNIGYIKIDIFNSNTEDGFSEAIEKLKDNNITKVILDLRGNPGGDVYQAAAVARYFVPKGVIASIDFKSESLQDAEINSDLDKPSYKLALLVDGQSASASEIIAGAVKDTGCGVVIGSKTFGKAKVQNVFPVLTPEAYVKYSSQLGIEIADGYELYRKYGITPAEDEIAGYAKITTGLYYTPKGKMIDGIGILPDIRINDPVYRDTIEISRLAALQGIKPLKAGSVGSEVLCAEKLLEVMGYMKGTPDVVYDAETVKAVRKFQLTQKIKADGIIGPVTRKLINRILDKAILKYDSQYSKALGELAG